MKIITWNVNRFDNVHDWYSCKEDLPLMKREECAKTICEKLAEMLKNKDDIAILQEIPYCDIEYVKNEWESIWKETFKSFNLKVMHWLDEEPSRTDFNYSGSMNVTIAVAKEDTNWIIRPFDLRKICLGKWKGCWNYLNRYIELENGNMSILGFHVNCNNNEQWEKIHLVAKNSEFTFIVGDFNVNDFLYPSQDALKQLETNYDRLVSKDIITQNQTLTSLDNIFVMKSCDVNAKVSVLDYCYISHIDRKANRNERCSDHNACICEIKNK